ncbi:hypothetical protein ACFO0N_13725 [Halobium salinum]|uniref:Uncharacterized protein n=2 Tax=Halobium salinum TaxID=1364940 RepID=A0ABD5PDZ4_9EURY
MWDPMDGGAETSGHVPKYLAAVGFFLSSILATVVVNSVLGLTGAGFVLLFLTTAGVLLWFAFLPLFKSLHSSPEE